MTTLLIVESPGKIKKIESLLGPEYKVIASIGHIIDLDKGGMSIEIQNKFNPLYIPNIDKTDVIKNILKHMKDSKTILLAADEDREGEMIAWSLKYIAQLKNKELYEKKVKNCGRIVFNSITKSELKNAMKHPRCVDINLVHAQQARRLLDRIVGYELSPLLWGMSKQSLSAGRVQSVVTRLIVDREQEIEKFLDKGLDEYYKFNGLFKCGEHDLKSVLYDNEKNDSDNEEDDSIEIKKKIDKTQKNKKPKASSIAKLKDLDSSKKLLKLMTKSTFSIDDVIKKERIQNPQPPFTTSTLQQEAGRKLGFDVKRTMMAAQKLYEGGYITYMRTDSTNLSQDALENIKKYVLEKHSDKYYQFREHKSKSKNTQEAHEACRATDAYKEKATGNIDEIKLYSLIWKRTVASQMKAAIFDILELIVNISKMDRYIFKSSSEVLKFSGYLIVYNLKDVEEEDNSDVENGKEEKYDKKSIKIGIEIKPKEIKATQEFKRPPVRYNETSLVSRLDPKNLNIGRPATYASIISKIQERKYVNIKDVMGINKNIVNLVWDTKEIKEIKDKLTIGNDKKKMVPTDLGIKITKLLIDNFPKIMDYKFTAHMEDQLDEIATGKLVWYDVLDSFYKEFHPLVLQMRQIRKEYTTDHMVIGTFPDNNEEIYLMTIKDKPVLKCGGKTNAIFCDIDCKVDKLTEKHAIKLIKEKMKYPKLLGEYKSADIFLKKGFDNFYISYGKITVSANENTLLSDAIKLLIEKDKNLIKVLTDNTITYTISHGKFGPYIRVNDNKSPKAIFVNIPPKIDPDEITLAEIKELIREHKEKIKKKYNSKTIDNDAAKPKDKSKTIDKKTKK